MDQPQEGCEGIRTSLISPTLGITNRGYLRTYILTWPCVSTLRDIKMLRDYLNVRDLRVLVYVLNL